MKSLYEIQRVRYPPFEASRWIPEALPVATKRIHLGDYATADDVLTAHGEHGPAFMIGKEDSWLLERRYEYGGEAFQLGELQGRVEQDPFVPLVKRQRRGWYLIPNPIHNILRAFIRAVVVVLLASLFYLFVSPLLLFIGIPVYGLNTIRWGLLDYPALAVFVVPLIFAPLFIRVLANLVELRRQQHFLNKNPPPPSIQFNEPSYADQPLKINIEFSNWSEDWNHVDVLWRVGVLPPAREAVLTELGRASDRQPPPGFSTELPHHWEVGLDDGTAGGEDAPMEIQEAKGGLYLRPMRIMANGESQRWREDQEVVLDAPSGSWPGSVNTDFLRVHWECILRIDRKKGGALLWVQPLKVGHPRSQIKVVDLPLHDGRSELDIS